MELENRWFQCKPCSKYLRGPKLFLDHKKSCKLDHLQVSEDQHLTREQECTPAQVAAHPIPKTALTSNSAISKKLRRRTGSKMHKCPYCQYSAVSGSLKTHIRIHTGEKPFRCDQCGRSFSTSPGLTRHQRFLHTKEKPLKCNLCPYRSSNSTNVKQHYKVHTGEKPYKCAFCEYRSSQNGNLREHIRMHTGEKPFECHKCGCKFAQSSALKIHLLKRTACDL